MLFSHALIFSSQRFWLYFKLTHWATALASRRLGERVIFRSVAQLFHDFTQ